jgi:hypothetical protein
MAGSTAGLIIVAVIMSGIWTFSLLVVANPRRPWNPRGDETMRRFSRFLHRNPWLLVIEIGLVLWMIGDYLFDLIRADRVFKRVGASFFVYVGVLAIFSSIRVWRWPAAAPNDAESDGGNSRDDDRPPRTA